ncbi:LytTR family DNA-binding domain-containing protein [Simiduia sp. 21SJ11W-1]|uniref:LytR/AlgR family response regulator transcription factor n=1 Tax=Simiduia sp. 21SJ11W-1 TaxID=2909669 RepID=UPI00209EBA54|nr:LytTR family DNA-binding domain-containing protein [Simiduia sp. 21SJ11W-1]UTA46952.1 LytTR family DNA-binding domain-containing protein [Simiduia sp. 21SJ11W-1]
MSDTINAIVVDDEGHARQTLITLLKAHPEINLVAECENGMSAVKTVNDLQPHLMFLDIQMPKLNGLEVLELLGDTAPLTVFVTAHNDYAIQAFEKNAVDYLLKPVSKARLAQSVERIQQRLTREQPTHYRQQQQTAAQQLNQPSGPIQRILVRDKGDVHVIPVADISAIEAADDYVVIHAGGQSHIKQERLSRLEAQLDAQQFCRIHRSTLINLDYLQGIETEAKETRFANLKLADGSSKQYAISRSGYSKLIELL